MFFKICKGLNRGADIHFIFKYPGAEAGASALKAVHGTEFTVGCIPCLLYVASGGASDWALGVANSTFSFSMELRDTGSKITKYNKDLVQGYFSLLWKV